MLFLLITRKATPYLQSKIRKLVRAGIDAYIMSDEKPEIESSRILHIPDSRMEEIGWTHHMSQLKNKITAWDKATYYAYMSKEPHVWICEDDVYWNTTSVIRSIVHHESNADLIAYPLAPTYAAMQDWYHWEKVRLLTPRKEYWTATYNQLCRVSRRLLERMAEVSHKRHRLYFHEGMFATLCNMHRYPIEYYNTMQGIYFHVRWNHPFTQEGVEDEVRTHKHVLLHPVKMEL